MTARPPNLLAVVVREFGAMGIFSRWRRKPRNGVKLSVMDTNQVFTAIPCFACGSWRRDGPLTLIGACFLALQRGEQPMLPQLVGGKYLPGCCRAIEEGLQRENTLTYDLTAFQKTSGRAPTR